MNRPAIPRKIVAPLLTSPRLTSALSVCAVGLGVFAFALHNTIGWAGLNSMIAALLVLCVASVLAQRERVDWDGVMPISLLLFLTWATLSILWSQYQWATAGGLAYLFGFTLLGLYVALMRDTIQIVRDVGDVLRLALVLSVALEVLSGLLIDSPIPFLNMQGSLSHGGPISGIVGNRNDLGLIAVVAAVSFAIEWRTRSVDRGKAVFSIALAGLTLLLTGSPIAWGTAVVAGLAMVALWGIRRLPPERRAPLQIVALVLAAIGALSAWIGRTPIVNALNADGELGYRLELWGRMVGLLPIHRLEGWGWMGLWQVEVPPYPLFHQGGLRETTSAVNAYLDVLFQLGTVGLALFLLFLGLAFVRSWLLATRRRSVIYTWPAVVLAALVPGALAESSILIEFGWLLVVVCAVKAAQELSWRTAFRPPLEQEPL